MQENIVYRKYHSNSLMNTFWNTHKILHFGWISVLFWTRNVSIAQVLATALLWSCPSENRCMLGNAVQSLVSRFDLFSEKLLRIFGIFLQLSVYIVCCTVIQLRASPFVRLIVWLDPQQLCMYILALLFLREIEIYIYKCMYTYPDCIFVDFRFDPTMWSDLTLLSAVIFL